MESVSSNASVLLENTEDGYERRISAISNSNDGMLIQHAKRKAVTNDLVHKGTVLDFGEHSLFADTYVTHTTHYIF